MDTLPTEILLIIAENLDPFSLLQFRKTAKWVDNLKSNRIANIITANKTAAICNSRGYHYLVSHLVFNDNYEFLKIVAKNKINWNGAMAFATSINKIDLIHKCIEHGADNWNECLIFAASTDNRNLVDFFLQKGATDLDATAGVARFFGHHQMLSYLDSLRANKKSTDITTSDKE